MRTQILALCFAASASGQHPTLSYPQLLDRIANPQWLTQRPDPGERCVQFSSYDPRSRKGARSPDDWYANNDRGNYLRTEARDGQKEHVMVDARGPGCISRIWSANPEGTLHFDIDGVRVWSVGFAELCSGQVDGVPHPIAGVWARGHNCYLPIPFQERIVISSSQGDAYYQVGVVEFGAAHTVDSFHPDTLTSHRPAIQRTAEVLSAIGSPPPRVANRLPERRQHRLEIPSSHQVMEFTIHAVPTSTEVDVAESLRRVLLVVRCDDQETIRVPVLDFFCGGASWAPHGGLLSIQGTTARCQLPMPMPKGGVIELIADGDGIDSLERRLHLHLESKNAPINIATPPLLLHAGWHSRKGFKSRPFHDHLVVDASGGPGRFVGCSLLVKNPHRAWWGEGDEKFTVDGEAFPSTFGTGTEDYFGYAWCDTATFSAPWIAQPQCDGERPHLGNRGHTANMRLQLLDSVPFQTSFHFDLEVWHWVGDLDMDYATVGYWYAPAGSTSALPPMPPADQRALDRLPPPKILRVEGAIEAETLTVVSHSGGRHQVQTMEFAEEQFSGDAQRWWMDGAAGDSLVLSVPSPGAGEYSVSVAFCSANDYGAIQCAINATPLGDPIDLYAPTVTPTGPLPLGTVHLPAGEVPFTIRLTGRNDNAAPRHMVGIDYFLLTPVK